MLLLVAALSVRGGGAVRPAAPSRRQALAGGAALALASGGGSQGACWAAAPGDDLAALRAAVRREVRREPALGASLVRLAFHDAIRRDGDRGGADGSVEWELGDPENVRLGEPLSVVRRLRPPSLSLADAIAAAGAEAVEALGGPRIEVEPGRRDAAGPTPAALSAPILRNGPAEDGRDEVTRTMPQPGLSTVGIRRYFSRLGFDDADIVALSGAHGLGRHTTLTGMTKDCLRNLTRACLEDAPVREPFVESAVDTFDNQYFAKLLKWDDRTLQRGEAFFIPTDVALVLDPSFKFFVRAYAQDEALYRRRFAAAFTKLLAL